jgi:uncharacterized protein YbbK (DUF523 family)
MMDTKKIKIGISACLLGENVRYDGGHTRDTFIINMLGPYVDFVPVCPEVECGLSVPRERMHLEGDLKHPRLIITQTQQDITDQLNQWAEMRIKILAAKDLRGFIFKSKSPSCGIQNVSIFDLNGESYGKGQGLFASIFMEYLPSIPVDEEISQPHLFFGTDLLACIYPNLV